MPDQRIERLADILVHHSVKVKKGETILIRGTTLASPLIQEVYRKVLQCGAHPITQVDLPEMEHIFYREADEEQLKHIAYAEMLYKHIDGYINIQSQANTKQLTGIDPAKLQLRRLASRPLLQYLMGGGVRWVLTAFPTNAYAQEAEMSLEEYEDFVYGATNIDYKALERTMQEAASYFNKAKKVRIVAEGTDITIDIEGREAVICSGEHNVPDGEFFFTPNHLLTEGTIYFDWPTVYGGREIQGIRLTFREGKIVEYSAEKGEKFLEQALNTDEGARYLGELGIGANFGIKRPTKDILFDERRSAVPSIWPSAGRMRARERATSRPFIGIW